MKKSFLLACFLLSISSAIHTAAHAPEAFSFLAISDLHVMDDGPGRQYSKFLAITTFLTNAQNNTKAILMPGDLTDSATKQQTINFDNYWFTPLTDAMRKTGGRVCASLGNHDSPTKQKKRPDIVNFVKDNCGDPYFYSFDIGDIHFACCYLHPGHWDKTICCGFSAKTIINSDILLEADLALNYNKKIILFWHFDIKGAFSSWWYNFEKNIAYKIIKPYNILHLFVGHTHSPQFTTYWEDGKGGRKIPVSLVGGEYFAFCKYNGNSFGTEDVNFMNNEGEIKSWQDMYQDKNAVKAIIEDKNTGQCSLM